MTQIFRNKKLYKEKRLYVELTKWLYGLFMNRNVFNIGYKQKHFYGGKSFWLIIKTKKLFSIKAVILKKS